MRRLDQEKEIVKLAAELKVDWRRNAVQNIIALCRQKISAWLKDSPTVKTIRQLEELVCNKLRLVFEEVYTDEELARIIKKYIALGEPIFATLKHDLDEKTFAALIERRKIDGNSLDRYVAVIDCRGQKAARRFFTRWHEIAHLLTLQGQLELPLHRSTAEQTPTERLMDTIAGEIGFYDDLFRPVLESELSANGRLSFEMVERVRARFCPEASFQSTMNACVARTKIPILILQVGLGLKDSEEKQIRSKQGRLFDLEQPQPKLRVLNVSANESARGTELQIHRNMEVPPSSILHDFFFKPEEFAAGQAEAIENLNHWRHSDGTCLADIVVSIRVRRFSTSLLVLVSPAH